jgi:hypothetical protein
MPQLILQFPNKIANQYYHHPHIYGGIDYLWSFDSLQYLPTHKALH